jgi:hypothetical protein
VKRTAPTQRVKPIFSRVARRVCEGVISVSDYFGVLQAEQVGAVASEGRFDMDQPLVLRFGPLSSRAAESCVELPLSACRVYSVSWVVDSGCERKTDLASPAVSSPQCGQVISPRFQGRETSVLNWNSFNWNGRPHVALVQRMIPICRMAPHRFAAPKVVPRLSANLPATRHQHTFIARMVVDLTEKRIEIDQCSRQDLLGLQEARSACRTTPDEYAFAATHYLRRLSAQEDTFFRHRQPQRVFLAQGQLAGLKLMKCARVLPICQRHNKKWLEIC